MIDFWYSRAILTQDRKQRGVSCVAERLKLQVAHWSGVRGSQPCGCSCSQSVAVQHFLQVPAVIGLIIKYLLNCFTTEIYPKEMVIRLS